MKKPKSLREQENSTDSNDRLSKLPDEVLVHILSFLPTDCAVKTMLLRRFGKLWTLVPALDFKYVSHKFVRNVMKNHKSPTIDRWEMGTNWLESIKHRKEVSKWVRVTLRKNPKVFCFESCQKGVISELPRVFTSQSIITLHLSYCDSLPRVIDMRSLRSLYLCCVEMVDEDLKTLEIGCPCLQELGFIHPRSLQKVHFTAPNIERLTFKDFKDYKVYSLNCPNLKFLHLDLDRFLNYPNLEVIDVSSVIHAKIFGGFDNVEYLFETIHKKFRNAKILDLNCQYHYEQLEQCGNYKLDIEKNYWYHLVLKSGVQGSCLLGICRLLKKSSCLNELTLYADVGFICNCDMLLQELSSPFEMKSLKIVTILDFEKPCNTLVQLVEFLLKSAVVLDKLVIVCQNKDQLISRKGFEFISELLNLPRASKDARVVLA